MTLTEKLEKTVFFIDKKSSLHSKKCVFTHSIITWDSKKLYIDWKLESWVSKKRAEFFVLWYFIWIDNEFQLSAVELTMQNLWCYEAFLNYATIAKICVPVLAPKELKPESRCSSFGLYGPGQSWAVGRLGRSLADWVTGWQAGLDKWAAQTVKGFE